MSVVLAPAAVDSGSRSLIRRRELGRTADRVARAPRVLNRLDVWLGCSLRPGLVKAPIAGLGYKMRSGLLAQLIPSRVFCKRLRGQCSGRYCSATGVVT